MMFRYQGGFFTEEELAQERAYRRPEREPGSIFEPLPLERQLCYKRADVATGQLVERTRKKLRENRSGEG